MARSRALNHYPARYQEIIRECGVEGKSIRVTMPDRKKAASLRGHWYAFIGSLKTAALTAEAAKLKRPLTEQELHTIESHRLAPTVMLIMEAKPDDTVDMVWQNRELSWQALALAAATVTQTESKPASGAFDEQAARLLQVQRETDK